MKPRGVKTLRVLYLFAGRQRKADICACLKLIADEFNASIDFGFEVALTVREIDVVRHGESDNLLSPSLQDELHEEALA